MALDCGLSMAEFWDMSIQEITDFTESCRRRDKERLRRDLMAKHFLAKDIGQHINYLLAGNGRAELKELWDYFPELFETEKSLCGGQQKDQQLAVYKAQMTDFTYRHNRKKGGGA